MTRLLPFGEACRYKGRSKEGVISGTTARWNTGVWIGIERRTGQYIMFDAEVNGIRHARTILRLPESQKWSVDKIREVGFTTWAAHEPTSPQTVFPRKEVADEDLPNKQRTTRRLYIRQEDLDQHGHTRGCPPKCDHMIAHGPSTGTMPHSEQCRARIMQAIASTPEGKERVQKVIETLDESMIEHMRRHGED